MHEFPLIWVESVAALRHHPTIMSKPENQCGLRRIAPETCSPSSSRLLLLFCGLGAWLGLAYPLAAWNGEGHMIVAQIAYNHLDPAVKAKCDALIAVPLTYASSDSTNFVTAACWADDYKNELGSKTWHYIDLPFSLDGTPTNGVVSDPANIVWAIDQSVFTLGNGSSSQTDQATALRYLIHFVGDIQQPLHCSTAVWASKPAGDGGGNGFYINGTWRNLHLLWDAGGGFLTDSMSRPLSSTSKTTLSNKVAAIETDYPYSPGAGMVPDPMDWAQEGCGLAQTVAYVGITQNTTPSTNYLNTAQATTEEQMAQGGHRLADLLNTLFTTNAVSLTWFRTNSSFGFSWSAIPGRTYHVQCKQLLSDPTWTDWAELTASSNSAFFSEPSAQAHRFYRVAQ